MSRLQRNLGLLVVVLFAVGILAHQAQVPTALRVGAGLSARVLCGLAHHTNLDPEWAMEHYVDHLLGPAPGLVSVAFDRRAGVVESRALTAQGRAIVRPGIGCTLVLDRDEAALRRFRDPPHAPPLRFDLAWPDGNAALERPTSPALAAALDAAFEEPEDRPGRMRQTLAVLVAHRGRLVAERYAEGIDEDSRLLSWSAAKSVIAALMGVAELEGRLDRSAPAEVAEWSETGDARGAITVDQLLRMSSGLAFDETYGATNDVSRMLFTREDAGAFAAGMALAHEPDMAWSYSSGTSNILARILRDSFDGDLEAMVGWSRTSLFDPVGMRSAVFEVDASGSFVGSSLFFATGRDWARFGQLHLQGGTWKGQRLLPEDWSRYVSRPTPKAEEGRYGAGWWLNAGDEDDPKRRMWPTLPRDTYSARGMSGQYVVIVPSAELVVVRFGLSQAGEDSLHGIEPLVAAAINALGGERPSSESGSRP